MELNNSNNDIELEYVRKAIKLKNYKNEVFI